MKVGPKTSHGNSGVTVDEYSTIAIEGWYVIPSPSSKAT
jgi:hypothetical protein